MRKRVTNGESEMSLEEIAIELGISKKAVKCIYFRAVRKLLIAYARLGIGPADIVGRRPHPLKQIEES